MLQFEELRLELLSYEDKLKDLAEALGLEKMKTEVAELEEESAKDGFWDDIQRSQKITQHMAGLKNKIQAYVDLNGVFDDTLTLIELANEEEDESLFDECRTSVDDFVASLDAMTLSTLLTGEYDKNNAILTFHAGAGGTEAQDWAQMLFRMYNRWGERHGFKVSTLDYLDGDEAGLKSAVILIEGENAYGYMKSESGIHRLVRVSPFDASGRRHTSHLLRLCLKSTTVSRLKSHPRILKWTFTVHQVQAVRRLIKPLPQFVLLIFPQVLFAPVRLKEASIRTVRLLCVCLNQSLLKSKNVSILTKSVISRVFKRKLLGVVRFVHTYLCPTLLQKTTEQALKTVI